MQESNFRGKPHIRPEGVWITPQINGLIMPLSFGKAVIDLFVGDSSAPQAAGDSRCAISNTSSV